MSNFFPIEIISQILVRLPAKSLHRFKCVCKSWNSLLTSDDNFKSSFHQHSILNPKLLFLKHPHNNNNSPIHFSVFASQTQTLVELATLRVPVAIGEPVKPTSIELININSVNGVLGIVVYLGLLNGPIVQCDMFIWNPSTCETVRLPNSDVTGLFYRPPTVKFYSGFGYDKTGVDYKVVRVVFTGSERVMCEVYSLRRNDWQELTGFHSGISSNTFWASEMCTYVDGVGYWGVYIQESKDEFCVLKFDFCKEGFDKIGVPVVCVDGKERKYQSLWEFRGVLALSVLHFGGFESNSTRIYIWELNSLSQCWCSLFNIDLEGGPRRPVVSLGSGMLVLLGENDGEHVLYDPVSGKVNGLGVYDVDHVVVYSESLMSLRSLLPNERIPKLREKKSQEKVEEDIHLYLRRRALERRRRVQEVVQSRKFMTTEEGVLLQ